MGTYKTTICVDIFVRVAGEPDRDSDRSGPRPAVAARPLRILRPFSTVMTSDRLSSLKALTFSRASGMVLIPPAGSKRGSGLIGGLTMVAGRGSSLSAVMFRSVAELQAAIERFIAETNADPKPFVWTARPNRILAAVKRGNEKLESIH